MHDSIIRFGPVACRDMASDDQTVGASAYCDHITVFHDELDLAPGKARVKAGGGHAGHNGLRSISAAIGEGYGRVRLGIGHPGRKEAVPGYVLHDFAKADEAWLDDLLRGLSDGAPHLAAGDAGKFMNAVAQRTAPPRSSKTRAEQTPVPVKEVTPETQDTRNAFQKLADRFR